MKSAQTVLTRPSVPFVVLAVLFCERLLVSVDEHGFRDTNLRIEQLAMPCPETEHGFAGEITEAVNRARKLRAIYCQARSLDNSSMSSFPGASSRILSVLIGGWTFPDVRLKCALNFKRSLEVTCVNEPFPKRCPGCYVGLVEC